MKIEHVAIWVKDLEKIKNFYQKYFKMESGTLYINDKKQFHSYFLSSGGNSKARLELMNMPDISENRNSTGAVYGYAHIAISVGTKEDVNNLTEQLRKDGYKILGEPRTTGDGCYESVIEDPEGNSIEITE